MACRDGPTRQRIFVDFLLDIIHSGVIMPL